MAIVLNGIMKELYSAAFKEKYKFSNKNTLETVALCVASAWDDDDDIRNFFDGTSDSLSLASMGYLHNHLKLTDKKIDRLIKKYNLMPKDGEKDE